MPREIKFRGLHRNSGIMSFSDNYGLDRFFKEVVDDNIELRGQYTGLKDKNGKEIYEGDEVLIIEDVVVEVIAGHERTEKEGRKEIVLWENGAFFIGDQMAWEEANYCEIIGNIYEGLHSGENTDIIKEWKNNTNKQFQKHLKDIKLVKKPK